MLWMSAFASEKHHSEDGAVFLVPWCGFSETLQSLRPGLVATWQAYVHACLPAHVHLCHLAYGFHHSSFRAAVGAVPFRQIHKAWGALCRSAKMRIAGRECEGDVVFFLFVCWLCLRTVGIDDEHFILIG